MPENESVSLYLDSELVAVLRARAKTAGVSFSSYVSDQLQSSIEGPASKPRKESKQPAASTTTASKEQIVKSLRDALRSIKKISPIKTELVELLTVFLKEGPADQSDAPSTLIVPITEPVLDEDAERAMDDYLEQRRQANINRSGGMQSIGNAVGSMFAPGGALERAANRGNIDTAEIRKVLDSSKSKDAPEPTDDDWFPEE